MAREIELVTEEAGRIAPLHEHLTVCQDGIGQEIVGLQLVGGGQIASNDIVAPITEPVETVLEAHLKVHFHLEPSVTGNGTTQLVLKALQRRVIDGYIAPGAFIFSHKAEDALTTDVSIIAHHLRALIHGAIDTNKAHRAYGYDEKSDVDLKHSASSHFLWTVAGVKYKKNGWYGVRALYTPQLLKVTAMPSLMTIGLSG